MNERLNVRPATSNQVLHHSFYKACTPHFLARNSVKNKEQYFSIFKISLKLGMVVILSFTTLLLNYMLALVVLYKTQHPILPFALKRYFHQIILNDNHYRFFSESFQILTLSWLKLPRKYQTL